MRILLLMPPMTQVNAPYPATAFLTGFLRGRGFACEQADLAIELVLSLFSQNGLQRMAAALPRESNSPSLLHFRDEFETYAATVDPVIRFLQGRDPSLALRITNRNFLPEGPRFAALVDRKVARPHHPAGAEGSRELHQEQAEESSEFKQMFDIILTSEDFSKSKPAPDCYLAGARRLGLLSTECIGFEDSFNGLLSVRAADMFVVGLSTTNTADSIRQFSDVIINNYNGLDYKKMCELITSFH